MGIVNKSDPNIESNAEFSGLLIELIWYRVRWD